MREVMNEPLIVGTQPKERLYLMNCFETRPIFDYLYVVRIHFNFSFKNYVTKENLKKKEFAVLSIVYN